MARSGKFAVALLVAGVLTVSGCQAEKKSDAEQAAQPEGLQLLLTNAKQSLQEAASRTAKAESVSVTLDGTVSGHKISSRGAVAFGPPITAELTSTGIAPLPISARVLDTDVYIQVPEQFRTQLGGKGWMKANLADTAQAVGIDADQLAAQLQNADPSKQLKTLLASGDLKAVGEESVDGVPTVHYAGTTPVASYLQNVDQQARVAVQRQLTMLGVTEVKTDLWVDEQYQVRKAHVLLGAADFTAQYSDYGKPVVVQPPPAGDTVDLKSFISNFAN